MAYLVSQATDARVTVTNLPLTHGLNLQPGDVLIAAVHWNSGTAITSDGNAFVTSFEEENPNTATSRLWIGYRVCGDSEPSSFAWSNAANDRCAVVLAQFRGIDPLNVWHVPPSASTRGIGQPVTTLASPPSLTTTNKYTVGIGIAFSDAAGFTFSDWTNGYGQEIEHGSGEGLAMVLRHYDTAGAKGTLNTTVSSSGDLVVHHLALNTNTVQSFTSADPVIIGYNTQGADESGGSGNRAVVSQHTVPNTSSLHRAYAYFDPDSTAGTSAKVVVYTADNNYPGTLIAVSEGKAVPSGGGLIDFGRLYGPELKAGQKVFVGVIYSDFQARLSANAALSGVQSYLDSDGVGTYASPATTWPATSDVSYTNMLVSVWLEAERPSALEKPLRFPTVSKDRQLPTGASVDWANPLTRDLRVLWNGADISREIISGAPLVIVDGGDNNHNREIMPGGFKSVAGSTIGAPFNPLTYDIPTFTMERCTLFCIASKDNAASTAWQTAFSLYDEGGVAAGDINYILYLGSTVGGTTTSPAAYTESPISNTQWADFAMTIGVPYTISYVRDRTVGERGSWVIDGRPVASETVNSSSATSLSNHTVSRFTMVSNFTWNTEPLGGNVAMVAVWNRQLSVGELTLLHRDPWQLFKRPELILAPPKKRRLVML